MSKLDELIKELCPNGVEYKELGEIVKSQRGKTITKELIKDGDIPVISGGQKPAYYHNESNRKGEVITVAGSGAYAGFVMYWDKPIFVSDAFSIECDKSYLNIKYIYYFLQNNQMKIHSLKKGGGVPHVYFKDMQKFLVPVPPLEVQNEIVRILDNFTALTAELTAELTARKKQYSWYRDYLLKFENKVEIVTLGDISEYSKDKIDIKELSSENYIGIENMLQDAKGVIKSSCLLTEGRCTKFFEGDILIGNIRPYLKKIWLSDRVGGANTDVLVIKKSIESIDNKYLFFVLSSEKFFSYVMRSVKAGKMPRGNKEMIMKYQFPLPPLEVQKRIVEVLDNFEKICNDLNIGLPAEIEARQKQYEFYRNFLLTFNNEEIYALSKQASKQASPKSN